jgi:hypothetical protein
MNVLGVAPARGRRLGWRASCVAGAEKSGQLDQLDGQLYHSLTDSLTGLTDSLTGLTDSLTSLTDSLTSLTDSLTGLTDGQLDQLDGQPHSLTHSLARLTGGQLDEQLDGLDPVADRLTPSLGRTKMSFIRLVPRAGDSGRVGENGNGIYFFDGSAELAELANEDALCSTLQGLPATPGRVHGRRGRGAGGWGGGGGPP